MFFDGIIINISIMLTGFYFISKLTTSPLDACLSLSKKIQIGLCNGLLCFVLMKFAIPTIHYTFIDLRHIPLVIIACYVGPLPTLITALIISVSRLAISFNDTAVLISMIYGLLGTTLALCSHYVQRSLLYRAILFSMISLVFICSGSFLITQDINKIMKFSVMMTFSSFLGIQFSLMLLKDIKQQKLEMITYQGQAQRDFLTGLLNRRVFDQAMQGVSQSKRGTALLLMDIDHFKHVNDNYGHDAGDKVLKDMARILDSYTASGQKFFRIGGEEFAAILTDFSIPLAQKIAEEIRQKIERNVFNLPNGQQINITISIGISSSEQRYDNNRLSLFQRADLALYQAKSNGRNQTRYMTDTIALTLIPN
ncbi:diguanylate cyclase [Jinshanibacter sp. LJY008]|uniref:diguanylate cyclase n=1 Tax=Limnobaculum eriocheiris TaxID=2897391 RepID=A0A9X1MVW3_9GAMM|nr:diguanylate cyclase [Limnobaculum eriocheiris]MCD1124707.1 diguanylate cyclase [Limnobaculum eriocheiris]